MTYIALSIIAAFIIGVLIGYELSNIEVRSYQKAYKKALERHRKELDEALKGKKKCVKR